MSRILDLTRLHDASPRTQDLDCEPISTSLERDLFLAMSSIVPGAALWIAFDYFYTGIALAVGIFLILEYTIPAYRAGRINLSILTSALSQIREVVRTRVARGA